MSEELLKIFAQSLKKQREEKGFTLQQVASKTRIDIKFLRSIESGEFNVMPEVYIRAFIKDYADVIDLDVVETLEKYEAAKTGKSIQKSTLEVENKAEEKIKEKSVREFVSSDVSEKPKENNKLFKPKQTNLIVLIVSIALVVLLGIYFLFFKSSSEVIIKEKPFNQILNGKQRFKTEPVEKVDTVAKNPAKLIQDKKLFALTVLSTDTVWLRMRIDDRIDKEFTLKPNEKQVITANDSINLLVGNLEGIKFLLNSKTYDFKGIKGQVQNFLINKNGIQKVKVKQINVDE